MHPQHSSYGPSLSLLVVVRWWWWWCSNVQFVWALSNAATKFGMDAVMRVFQQYDPNRSGSLDGLEFARAARDFGLGLAGHMIFRGMDPDRSGTVDYREFMAALERGAEAGSSNRQAKQKISEMVWAWDKACAEETRRVLAIQGWKVRGHTVEDVQEEMRRLLRESGGQVADLIRRLDVDAGMAGQIDAIEFNRAMVNGFGFEGPLRVIDEVFASLDDDKSGKIGFDEMFEFVRGRRHSLDPRQTKMHLLSMDPPRGCGYTLEQVAWDEKVVQRMLHAAMERVNIGPADVIEAWDRNHDRQLSEAEFVSHVQGLFPGSASATTSVGRLWKSELEPLIRKVFNGISRKAGDSKLFAQKVRPNPPPRAPGNSYEECPHTRSLSLPSPYPLPPSISPTEIRALLCVRVCALFATDQRDGARGLAALRRDRHRERKALQAAPQSRITDGQEPQASQRQGRRPQRRPGGQAGGLAE